jgi:alginate O-acetyltransferase complex protein AlgI
LPGPGGFAIPRDGTEAGRMLFCTQKFLLFFLVVFTVYWTLPWARARIWLLLAASVFFYASWNKWLCVLVVGTATLDFVIARGLDVVRSDRGRRALLLLSIGTNLGVLGYLKYANFFLDSLYELMNRWGAHVAAPILPVIVPIGISFYTFEAISYTVDVYRRKIRAERDLSHFLLFILFFPHLVAGPIVRAADFLPQVRRRKRWSWVRARFGLGLCVLGLLKKMAIADRMAVFADPVFSDPGSYRTSALWFAALAYLIQVYGDFSGYSDLALGTAHLLGYRLTLNFNLPYLSTNVADFWRRWHISLGSWLRDYLFFPLGGSRAGPWRTAINLFIVMTACGLWHGAAWPFICFGMIHGIWLGMHRWIVDGVRQFPRLDAALQTAVGTTGRVVAFLFAYMLSVVVFRSISMAAAGRMFAGMFGRQGGKSLPLSPASLLLLAAIVMIGHVVAAHPRWPKLTAWLPAPVRGLGYAAAIMAALLLAPDAGQAFIYFQF